ncbi:unnamed protein product [Notodromas monacha]|uniref:J domain-containing protein n=1 Tax=Notodromas monacha TaxID=399045 RepID=A0A7R9GCL1_9CRUS|nr:unnamed protein product [Notodromas monacha]CAG0915962.1 unnamed protein product [Notodromas monacha]
MEVNKDEAIRCYEIAREHYRTGRQERAEKLLRKSISLFPTPEAEELLEEIGNKRRSSHGGNDHGTRTSSNSRTSSEDKTSGQTFPNSESNYSTEQIEAVKRVKSCKNFYEILNVSKDAADTELKKQYRRLALLLHPDKNKLPGAAEAFKAVGNAYAILSDVQKRKEYDMYGAEGLSQTSPRQRRTPGHDFYSFEADISAEELFNMFFGGGFPSSNVYHRSHRYHRHFNHEARSQTRTEPEANSYSVLFNLMPLLMLIFLTLIGNWFAADPLYSLSPTSKYSTEKVTANLKFPYYVKSDFEETYKGSIRTLERNVEEDYISTLRHNCYKERNYSQFLNDSVVSVFIDVIRISVEETLMWQARTYGDPARLKRAQEMETPACKRLTQIYG